MMLTKSEWLMVIVLVVLVEQALFLLVTRDMWGVG